MKNTDLELPGFLPLLQLIPKNSDNRYFYENGLSKLIPRLKLKVHSEIEDCFYLWDKFSPKKTVFDLWDFRYSWYEGYGYKPYFYTLYEGKKPLAILPLWFDSDKKRYEWFGSNWMEDNIFLTVDEHFIDLLFAVLPVPIHLNALQAQSVQHNLFSHNLQKDDPKNIKDLSPFKSIDEFLQSFDKKHRYNLRADFYQIQNLKPRIVDIETNNKNFIEKMIDMNIEQFKSDNPEDESDLVVPKRAQTYRNIVKNSGIYKTKFIQVLIQNHLAGIDFIIEYKNIYYPVKGGNDLHRFKGIGNFMIYYEFEDAINSGYSMIDCLQVDYGWKHRFFDQKPLYLFEK